MYEVKEEKRKNTSIIFFVMITIIIIIYFYIMIGKKNNEVIMKETIKTVEAKERQVDNDITKSKVPLDNFTSVEFEKKTFKILDDYIFSINDGIFKITLSDEFECKIRVINKKYSSIYSDKNKIKKDIEKEFKEVKNVKEVKYDGEKHLKYEIDSKHIVLYRKQSKVKTYRIEILSNDKKAEEVYKKYIKKIIAEAK